MFENRQFGKKSEFMSATDASLPLLEFHDDIGYNEGVLNQDTLFSPGKNFRHLDA